MLIAWIAVEVAFIREFSWLQPSNVAVGITFVVIGYVTSFGLRSAAMLTKTKRDESALGLNGLFTYVEGKDRETKY
jgi:hypothetical protein